MNDTEERIRYCFKNRGLLTTALTHSSYSQHGENNERLEFLGDAVLELVISEYLYKNLNLAEGKMTKLRANIVCSESLSSAAQGLGLGDQLRLGKGERITGGSRRRTASHWANHWARPPHSMPTASAGAAGNSPSPAAAANIRITMLNRAGETAGSQNTPRLCSRAMPRAAMPAASV